VHRLAPSLHHAVGSVVVRNNAKGGEAAAEALAGGAGVYFDGRGYMEHDVSAGRVGGGSSVEEDEGAQPGGQAGTSWGKRRAPTHRFELSLSLFGWMTR